MSYDVDLLDKTGMVHYMDESFVDGGTYCVGGTTECSINITYNYAEVFGGLVRELHGKVAKDTLPQLQAFVKQWQHARPYEKDYWAPTPGNARTAIMRLISFAEKHPDGVWEVS